MAFFDLPLEKLQTYRLPEKAPRDLAAFWKKTLAESAKYPIDAHYEEIADPIYQAFQVSDVTYRGFMGQPIKGWFVMPRWAVEERHPLPCVVNYIGYSGGRSFPFDHFGYPSAGYASFVMDTRGQGYTSPGHTPDDFPAGGPASAGWMTRGIESKETYYYRRVFTDAARAVEAAMMHPLVDPERIAVTGGSQGGGIAIAAAALAGKLVKLCMTDVPFLCGYRRALQIVDTNPYQEIALFLKGHRDRLEQVYQTLSYFDGVHLASMIKARCLYSVGLMDTICPPSTVFASYNNVKAPKEIRVYHYNNHEGGGPFQHLEKLRFLQKYLTAN